MAAGYNQNNPYQNFGSSSSFDSRTASAHSQLSLPAGAPYSNLIHAKTYVNRLRYHSINVMAVCDHQKRFTYVAVGNPGSMHDAKAFRQSSLPSLLQKLSPDEHILGDEHIHCSLASWAMKPIRDDGHLSARQKAFNKKLSRTRVLIENAFGLCKGTLTLKTFRRLKPLCACSRFPPMKVIIFRQFWQRGNLRTL